MQKEKKKEKQIQLQSYRMFLNFRCIANLINLRNMRVLPRKIPSPTFLNIKNWLNIYQIWKYKCNIYKKVPNGISATEIDIQCGFTLSYTNFLDKWWHLCLHILQTVKNGYEYSTSFFYWLYITNIIFIPYFTPTV